MDGLILENVRCFRERKEIPLAPLTFLVGENSTGKSTLLAATRLAWDIGHGNWEPNFNEEPYQWGAFDQIATFVGGRGGRADHFCVGYFTHAWGRRPQRVDPKESKVSRVWATFGKKAGQPKLTEVNFEHGPYSLQITPTQKKPEGGAGAESYKGVLSLPSGRVEQTFELPVGFPGFHRFIWDIVTHYFMRAEKTSVQTADRENVDQLTNIIRSATRPEGGRPFAGAPIRTRPRRTYDPLSSRPRPTGEHTPVVLAQKKAEEPTGWQKLQDRLSKFGDLCRLFNKIDIKELGKPLASPFQVRVKVGGPRRNLVDVGYGVSQALPIIVESILGPESRTFLFQQPEVHLHPKAQAELGSLLGELAKQEQKRFIIETHGDYILDRVRSDIREGKNDGVSPKDVQILFCEKEGSEVQIHELKVDKRGNIRGAPPTYRQFFLKEKRRLLRG